MAIINLQGRTIPLCRLYSRPVLIEGNVENMDNHNIDKVAIWEKANLTIREAAEYSNIGIKQLEELLKRPNCSSVLYVGKKKLVKRREFEKFLGDTVEICLVSVWLG